MIKKTQYENKDTNSTSQSQDDNEYEGIAELFTENDENEYEGIAELFVENDENEYEGIAELFTENDENEYEGIAELFAENNDVDQDNIFNDNIYPDDNSTDNIHQDDNSTDNINQDDNSNDSIHQDNISNDSINQDNISNDVINLDSIAEVIEERNVALQTLIDLDRIGETLEDLNVALHTYLDEEVRILQFEEVVRANFSSDAVHAANTTFEFLSEELVMVYDGVLEEYDRLWERDIDTVRETLTDMRETYEELITTTDTTDIHQQMVNIGTQQAYDLIFRMCVDVFGSNIPSIFGL